MGAILGAARWIENACRDEPSGWTRDPRTGRTRVGGVAKRGERAWVCARHPSGCRRSRMDGGSAQAATGASTTRSRSRGRPAAPTIGPAEARAEQAGGFRAWLVARVPSREMETARPGPFTLTRVEALRPPSPRFPSTTGAHGLRPAPKSGRRCRPRPRQLRRGELRLLLARGGSTPSHGPRLPSRTARCSYRRVRRPAPRRAGRAALARRRRREALDPRRGVVLTRRRHDDQGGSRAGRPLGRRGGAGSRTPRPARLRDAARRSRVPGEVVGHRDASASDEGPRSPRP